MSTYCRHGITGRCSLCKAEDVITEFRAKTKSLEETNIDLLDTAMRYGLDPDFKDRGEQIKALKDKLAAAEKTLKYYILSKEVGLDRGLDTLKRLLATLRGEDK